MLTVKSFCFNAFYENTYILFDETKECVIIDPGISSQREQKTLTDFISENSLNPVKLLNTHCHIDHILGNSFVTGRYHLKLYAHRLEEDNIRAADVFAAAYGMPEPRSPHPDFFLEEGDIISFGNTRLKTLYVPGHSAGHVAFYIAESNMLVNGDVLFHESIGRTDLPGGNMNTLLHSIRTKIFTLPDETLVFCGHGNETTVGHEKKHNPFLR